MKYSMMCLDKALEVILPGCDKWPNVGRPTLMDMAAKQCFCFPEKYEGINEAFAIIVIRAALREIKEIGWMTFGASDIFGDMS